MGKIIKIKVRDFGKQRKSARRFWRGALITAAAILICGGAVWAGSLTPASSPAATGYTLADIYNRLDTNATTTAGSHDFSPAAGPAASMRTIDEIYEKIPTIEAGKILAGTTYLGVAGTIADCAVEGGNNCYANSGYWTAAAGDNVAGGAGLLTFDIPDGYYSGKTATAADADLIASNIKSGVNLFGVDGDGNVVNTSSGDAAAGDILSGKIAWVDGTEITGSAAAGANVAGSNGSLVFNIPDGLYSGTKTCTAADSNLTAGNIKSGVAIFGVTGNYSVDYTWTKAGAGSWEGVNENLDWAVNIGPSGWSSQTYSYCGAATCANDGSLQGAASYDGPPGGWNGSNDYTNFNNSALHNYEVITADGTNLVGCTADAGDLVFPDGSAWDKSNAKPYSAKLAGCDSNNASSTEIWAAAGGSGPQYAYARNAPSALAIADAWDGKKNLAAGANGTHSYTNTGKNDDYYDRPTVSWYANTGDGAGTSRLPMIEEYERARQGTSDSAVSLLYGSNSWSYYNWSAEQTPYYSGYARNFTPNYGYANDDDVDNQDNPLWVVVAGQ